MDRILRKKYCRITFRLASPLMLGSGENDVTDKDLAKDSQGRPYIPASSIAGVVREKLCQNENTEALVKEYLGDVGPKGINVNSSVIFYDAGIPKEIKTADIEKHITIRDSVALDEYKTAKKGAKFDMEVLEPGECVRFETYVEQSFDERHSEDILSKIAKLFADGEIRFGGKSMRGYGEIDVESVETAEFSLDKKEKLEKWLEFDIFEYSEWKKSNAATDCCPKELRICLRQVGGISIRKYTTEVAENGKAVPDFEQLTLYDDTPVIPGTSWAGSFRHRMEEFEIEKGENSIFGYVKGNGANAKSRSNIRFSESRIEGAKGKALSRNAIDRFSGGAKDSALFTEKTYYGGTTELKIGWNSVGKRNMTDIEKKALAAAITDLHFGFMAIGGETSIGRGLFKITEINGEAMHSEAEAYKFVLEKIEEVF